MVMMAEVASRQSARLRAAVDRLHAAQVAALDARVAPAGDPAATRDAYGAESQVLAHLAEVGSLLVRLGGSAQVDAESAEIRRRVVTLTVACANTLAELVSLAFEVESAGVDPGESDEPGRADSESGGEDVAEGSGIGRAGHGEGGEGSGGGGSKGPGAPARITTSMRAVTDTNLLLVEQLRRLMQNVGRRESWRSARPGELWRGLLLQVADLFPLVAELEVGALSEADAKELARLAADAANYVAFLRFYPRLPTVRDGT